MIEPCIFKSPVCTHPTELSWQAKHFIRFVVGKNHIHIIEMLSYFLKNACIKRNITAKKLDDARMDSKYPEK